MFVVRPARMEDIDGLLELAKKTGTGLTTLPDHRSSLEKKVTESLVAFSAPVGLTDKRSYLLVLEDVKKGVIAGTSALISGVGLDQPFYSYRILHVTQVSHDPELRVDTEILQLSNDFVGTTEVATLFLDPDYRVGKLGKLLSKARYLLMAAHPDRFSDAVISEIRGWIDDKGNSPFWEAIGRHFFQMDFKTADEINGRGNSQFIADLMPKFPIYRALLPEAARNVIGKPHDSARPAIKLLENEGFRFSGAVDIFDGGPAYEVHRRGIWTVRKSIGGTLGGTVEGEGHDPKHLACNPSLENFRVVLTNVIEGSSGQWMPYEAAQLLELNEGDDLRYSPIDRIRTTAQTK
ncbi:arginine N-succinyltransferase [Kordiimonas marina]|uniref:arginine N-succinyltransferase n=1 Tax=Kordiimonas marina TaxID=2872312 RepID=UPI001FF551DC|nr:arginine N-succinyltransferase [Kordiimonas marina]MCJ9429726.1 arginine N-succinyltransferase [Kordiimonas marina]